LLETVRAYAAEHLLHAGEAEALRDRHRDWYTEWARSFSCHDSFLRAQAASRMRTDAPNAVSAIETSEAQGRLDLVATIAGRLRTIWATGIDPGAHERWLALGADAASDPDDRTACLVGAAWMNQRTSSRSSVEYIDLAVAASADATPALRVLALASRSLIHSVIAAFTRDREAIARIYADLEEAAQLASELSDDWVGFVQLERGLVEITFGRFAQAVLPFEEGTRCFDRTGNSALAGAIALEYATIAHIAGDDDAAVRAFDKAQRHLLDLDVVGVLPPSIARAYRAGTMTLNAAMLAQTEGVDAARAFVRGERERWRAAPLASGGRPLVLNASRAAAQVEDYVLACAILDTIEGRHRRAAVALSWMRATTLDRGIPPHSRTNYALYVHYRGLVREALGRDDARRARDEGARLSTDDVIALISSDD
jgi:hypothetical protein